MSGSNIQMIRVIGGKEREVLWLFECRNQFIYLHTIYIMCLARTFKWLDLLGKKKENSYDVWMQESIYRKLAIYQVYSQTVQMSIPTGLKFRLIYLFIPTHSEINSDSWIRSKSDCIYHYPIDVEPNGIPFGSKSITIYRFMTWKLQSYNK